MEFNVVGPDMYPFYQGITCVSSQYKWVVLCRLTRNYVPGREQGCDTGPSWISFVETALWSTCFERRCFALVTVH